MLKEILQILLPALIGALSGYLINQLPPLRTFRRSRLLVVAVVIELTVLSAIGAWLSQDVAKTSNLREPIVIFGAIFFGAFLVNILQLIFGNIWGGSSQQANPPQPPTDQKTVVKGTKIKGNANEVEVSKNNAVVENTDIEGANNTFSVIESSLPSPSSQQNNSPNP